MLSIRQLLGIVAGLLLIALLIAYALRQRDQMLTALPVPIVCADAQAAYAQALADTDGQAVRILAVAGTGSMAPLIPAAPAGADPLHTVVAYVTLRPVATFSDVRLGSLCLYRADWLASDALPVLHQAAAHDTGGWIMSGLHNANYESGYRMTATNFLGIADTIFVWPLEVSR